MPPQPARTGQVRPARTRRILRPAIPISGWLALASATIVIVFLIGNFLAQRSTRVTTEKVTHVERRFEPQVRLARDLERAISSFDRAVLGYLKFDTPTSDTGVNIAARDLLMNLAEYERMGEPPSQQTAGGALREQIAMFHRDGMLLITQQKARQAVAADYWVAMNQLRRRILAAGGGGVPVGNDRLFARGYLSDLATALATMRDSAATALSRTSPGASARAEKDELDFRRVLRRHLAELKRSPGMAWLEFVNADLARASRQWRSVARLEAEIEAGRRHFGEAATHLKNQVQEHLQEPAWRALTESARTARITAQETEHVIFWVGAAVLLVVLGVAGAAAFGVTMPVRRLTAGTRKLAAGELAIRVPRGGVREIDELAIAFNQMAERLTISEQTVRSYQAKLEDRVAERTRQLRHLAHHDPLTELPNRRQLFAYLNGAVTRAQNVAQPLGVLFVDLDNFKTINDSLGHEFGDTVLHSIATRLRTLLTPKDFIARFGGDEFTLVLAGDASVEAMEDRVAQLIAAFQQPLTVGQRELLVGTSIGVAICPDHGTDAESLLRAADAALFRAKELGRNRFSVYSPEMLAAATSRFRIEQALRKAIDADDLLLYFQPEISPLSLQTNIAEALLRWRQPDGTVLPAVQFLSIAEQSGLILDLNNWVLKTTARMLRDWRGSYWPQARIAINASSQQFLTGNFVTDVERLLRAADLPPECLELELTETMLQTGAVTIESLHALRTMGVTVALDDFGTGYSSLTSLEQLPLNRVKLDRSLIAGIDSNPRSAAIARSIIGMCHSLGLQVTAEGVERASQLEFLSACGDVHVQGYLIARPVSAEELIQLVRSGYPHLMWLRQSANAATDQHVRVAKGGRPVRLLRPRPR